MPSDLSPRIRVTQVDLHVLPMRTRFPFRYGIASLSQVPHVYVNAEVEIDGQKVHGISSEGLPPKWFTKNPRTSNAVDLAEMVAVVQNSARLAVQFLSKSPRTYFANWQILEKEIGQWGFKQGHPPLLYHLGVSLIERAIVDALCTHLNMPFHKLVKTSALGVDWSVIHPGLQDHSAADFLPSSPLSRVAIRHTVGLGDVIRNQDLLREEIVNDGLPQTLEDAVATYGLRYFKIKLSGDVMSDVARLQKISEVITHFCGSDFSITLDGNEAFQQLADFRFHFERLRAESTLKPLLEKLLWVEQPLHRSRALQDNIGPELAQWPTAPLMIIDESDGTVGDVQKALRLGYSGVSHKNCKGIIKGLANAALIHHHRRLRPKKTFVLSGEDLCTVGPVCLTQDLAMMALLGIDHVERNGHHYYRGLTMYSNDLVDYTQQAHPDLYQPNNYGLVTLNIQEGAVALGSVNAAPFGCGVAPDLSQYPLLKDWVEGGGIDEITAA